jgi:hypothetical protein
MLDSQVDSQTAVDHVTAMAHAGLGNPFVPIRPCQSLLLLVLPPLQTHAASKAASIAGTSMSSQHNTMASTGPMISCLTTAISANDRGDDSASVTETKSDTGSDYYYPVGGLAPSSSHLAICCHPPNTTNTTSEGLLKSIQDYLAYLEDLHTKDQKELNCLKRQLERNQKARVKERKDACTILDELTQLRKTLEAVRVKLAKLAADVEFN